MTHYLATTAATQYIELAERKLAYRDMGKGTPIVCCNRFRGILDSWDPAFLDQLAAQYRVILFDYSGVGLSTGELATTIAGVAADVLDLVNALKLEKFIILGWSFGGYVAQAFSVQYPAMITHTILIGTNPPGKNEHPMEQIFIDTSAHVQNDLTDEEILFFEPASEASRLAAKLSHDRIALRTADNDIPVPPPVWPRYFQAGMDFTADPSDRREKLGRLDTPVLLISGDHDVVFPVQNWYTLTRAMKNLYLVVLPQSGHGPQHQYVSLCVRYMIDFIKHYRD